MTDTLRLNFTHLGYWVEIHTYESYEVGLFTCWFAQHPDGNRLDSNDYIDRPRNAIDDIEAWKQHAMNCIDMEESLR